jgi:hypothetical protein
MDYFPSLKGRSYAELQTLLFHAVSRGDIRGLLNEEIVPKAHIGIYLSLYARATPDQEPNTLPPDLALNYDDSSGDFDRPSVDNRKRGRPVKEHSAGQRIEVGLRDAQDVVERPQCAASQISGRGGSHYGSGRQSSRRGNA